MRIEASGAMFALLASLSLFITGIVSGFSPEDSWISVGPSGAIINCLHMDTANDVLFAGTLDGFQYLQLSAGNWIPREITGSVGREVFSIINCPVQPGCIITARENAFFKGYMEYSSDWGLSDSVTFSSQGGRFVDIQNTPDDPDTYYACAWSDIIPGDLLKSENRGVTWTSLTGYMHDFMTEIAINPLHSDTIVVAGNSVLTRSLDGGLTWASFTSGLPPIGVYCVSFCPGNPLIMLASNDNGIYRSEDSGANWTLVNSDDSDSRHFAFNPTNPDMVVCVTFSPCRLLGSVDCGITWNDWTGNYSGDSMIDVVFSGSGDSLYVASKYSGVFRMSTPTGIIESEEQETVLSLECSPNPFSSTVKIEYSSAAGSSAADLTLEIYSGDGRLQRTWKGAVLQQRNYVIWDGEDLSGHSAAPGVYFIRLSTQDEVVTGRLVLLE